MDSRRSNPGATRSKTPRAKRRLGPRMAPREIPILFARQDIPTGIPSNIKTKSPHGVPGDDETPVTTVTEPRVTVTATASTITITSLGDSEASATKAPNSADRNDSGDLSGGTIAGIVIGVLAFYLLLAALFFWRHRKRKKVLVGAWKEKTGPASAAPAEVDGADVVRPPSELPGSHGRGGVWELEGSQRA